MKHTLPFATPPRSATRAGFGARGFTLIELMVVLAVAAIVSAITLGGFKEMREGNKRVSCQTNLSQIYQAARLYAADEGGKLPFYGKVTSTGVEPYDCAAGAATATLPTNTGIGLWALYTFPQGRGDTAEFSTIAPVGDAPIERYLRSARSLHCPSDIADGRENLYDDPDKTKFNPNYLSYQVCDDGGETPSTSGGTPTYSSVRTTATDNSAGPWKRQLLNYNATNFVSRQPTGDTVVTYCIFHRHERGMDNVLFYDGSVQLLAKESNAADNWKRTPKAPQ
jgi:prepilin-type N-terminal cleavage/methylation domain-containing protein